VVSWSKVSYLSAWSEGPVLGHFDLEWTQLSPRPPFGVLWTSFDPVIEACLTLPNSPIMEPLFPASFSCPARAFWSPGKSRGNLRASVPLPVPSFLSPTLGAHPSFLYRPRSPFSAFLTKDLFLSVIKVA